MVVAFYFRLHLAYFPRPVVAIFARPEHGTVAKRVDLLRDLIPTIILIQRDLVGVHAVEGIGIKAKEYKEPLFSIKRGISS